MCQALRKVHPSTIILSRNYCYPYFIDRKLRLRKLAVESGLQTWFMLVPGLVIIFHLLSSVVFIFLSLTSDFYTLKSSLCSFSVYFFPWWCLPLTTPYALAWFSSTPCVSILPLCAPQLPQNIHGLPTFSPQDLPFPSFPTSCSPSVQKRLGTFPVSWFLYLACSCCLQ